jgi:hypothetical protein
MALKGNFTQQFDSHLYKYFETFSIALNLIFDHLKSQILNVI